MEELITINCDDIMSSDEYDVQPQFVELGFNQEGLIGIQKAITVLTANPEFHTIVLTNFRWDVDQEYAGKPRNGKLYVRKFGNKSSFTFRFINEWTGTEYFVDLLDEVAQPLIDWSLVRSQVEVGQLKLHRPPHDFEHFLGVYGFVENTGQFACGGSIGNKSYGWETFSPDIGEVLNIANTEPGRVHTVVDGDDGRLWLTSGYHLVNRVFYIITQKPYLGPDFDIPCEEPRDFDRLNLEAFEAMDPDEEIYWAENGGYYDKQAFLDLVNDDIALAYRLYALCEWQCPETLLDEDRNALPEDRVFPELF